VWGKPIIIDVLGDGFSFDKRCRWRRFRFARPRYETAILWQDKNHDGISTSEEFFTLAAIRIESIDLHYQEKKWVDRYGNQFRFRAKVGDAKHSSIGRWAYDVFLVQQ
jgi:hypothetical protein